MKQRSLAMCLLAFFVAHGAANCYADSNVGQDRYDVCIVNKQHLSTARLAEAIAAKALLTDDRKMLRSTAEMAPNNPMYWHLLARKNLPDAASETWFEDAGWAKRIETARTHGRLLLERALRADPNYLPALYAYAMTKPMHEQRMTALGWLAQIDADNAEPYYLMAIEEYLHTIKGRKITEESERDAFEMSLREWQIVSNLIEQGNSRPIFTWRVPCLPSVQDVRVTTGGKPWPNVAVTSLLPLYMDLWNCNADSQYDPLHPTGGAIWRQFARQAKWAARAASQNGDDAQALRLLTVMMDLGYKCADCKPERILPLLIGMAVWNISEDEAVQILKHGNDNAGVRKLKAEKAAWKNACSQCMPLLYKTTVTLKSIRASSKDYLIYNDYAAEEAGMKKILAELTP